MLKGIFQCSRIEVENIYCITGVVTCIIICCSTYFMHPKSSLIPPPPVVIILSGFHRSFQLVIYIKIYSLYTCFRFCVNKNISIKNSYGKIKWYTYPPYTIESKVSLSGSNYPHFY